MTAKTEVSAPKRRTRAEVQQLVAEFVSSGMRRSEFCQSRGLSFSTLDRHLKKRRWKRRRRPTSSAGRLVPVELAAKNSATQQQEPSCGLAVVLPSGRKPCLDWAQLPGSIWPPGSPTCARGSKGCTDWFGIDCRVSLSAGTCSCSATANAIGLKYSSGMAADSGSAPSSWLHTTPLSIGSEGLDSFPVLKAAARSESRSHRLQCFAGGEGGNS